MNKKKNSLFAHLISLAVQTIRAKLALLILFSSVFAILAFATYFSFLEMNGFRQVNLLDFEVGKVAERDVTTSREISFVDENATRIRREARQKLITAVFRYDNALSASMQNNFSSFALFLTQSFNEYRQFDQFMLNLQQEYPGILEQKEAKKLFSAQNRDDVLLTARSLFKQLVNEGVTAFPDAGMERFNELEVEVVRSRNDRVERQEVPIKTLLTRDGLRSYVVKSLSLMQKKRKKDYADLIDRILNLKINQKLLGEAEKYFDTNKPVEGDGEVHTNAFLSDGFHPIRAVKNFFSGNRNSEKGSKDAQDNEKNSVFSKMLTELKGIKDNTKESLKDKIGNIKEKGGSLIQKIIKGAVKVAIFAP
ncbi:MAG TPA: hypothetical protein PKH40_09725, partial [Treponemataceae bacterium]|nr:hypothetical protein [Treponemataceae bacterium]